MKTITGTPNPKILKSCWNSFNYSHSRGSTQMQHTEDVPDSIINSLSK